MNSNRGVQCCSTSACPALSLRTDSLWKLPRQLPSLHYHLFETQLVPSLPFERLVLSEVQPSSQLKIKIEITLSLLLLLATPPLLLLNLKTTSTLLSLPHPTPTSPPPPPSKLPSSRTTPPPPRSTSSPKSPLPPPPPSETLLSCPTSERTRSTRTISLPSRRCCRTREC